MATPANPAFGGGFNADLFRENIKSTMQMGSPNAVADKATFQWPVNSTFVGKTDPSGRPYDFASQVVSENKKEDVQVDCAVEFVTRAGDGTPIGDFENPRAVLTLLDVDYEQVRGATKVLLGGNSYKILFTEPPVGLFTVTVFSIHLQAEDES